MIPHRSPASGPTEPNMEAAGIEPAISETPKSADLQGKVTSMSFAPWWSGPLLFESKGIESVSAPGGDAA